MTQTNKPKWYERSTDCIGIMLLIQKMCEHERQCIFSRDNNQRLKNGAYSAFIAILHLIESQ